MPLFDAFDIEKEIDRALLEKYGSNLVAILPLTIPKLWWPLMLIPDGLLATMILRARYCGRIWKRHAKLSRQVRLRNLGGLIIIDFIDMASAAHREQVSQTLELACKKDRARIKILGDLGVWGGRDDPTTGAYQPP